MSEQYAELDALDPQPDLFTFKYSGGIETEVVALQTRQLFRLLRILTHGAGMALQRNPIDFSRPADEFGGQLAIMVLVSIPDAEEEALQFIQSMVRPAGLPKGIKLNKQDSEASQAKWNKLRDMLNNPNPNDLVDLITFIIDRDKENLLDLGKRLWAMAAPYFAKGTSPGIAENPSPEAVAEMTVTAGPEIRLDEPPSVQAGSPPPSTSSPASTAGATKSSSTSRSAASSKSSPPSQPDVMLDSAPVPG